MVVYVPAAVGLALGLVGMRERRGAPAEPEGRERAPGGEGARVPSRELAGVEGERRDPGLRDAHLDRRPTKSGSSE